MFTAVPLAILLLAFGNLSSSSYSPQPHYRWSFINYTWPSAAAYRDAVATGAYVKEHNIISGVKRWRDKLYLAVLRLENGVPVALASIPVDDSRKGPLLAPFPNWPMQKLNDCRALQYVQSFQIDTIGRMWLIDNGRYDIRMNKSRISCPTRLLVLDLEDNGKILLDYIFPEGVVHSSTVYLNDLAIDHEDGGFAYITDNDSRYPGIVVFSLRQRRSWKVYHPSSMLANPESYEIIVNDTKLEVRSNVNGITISPASSEGIARLVYYCPISSYELFAIPTLILKAGINVDLDKYVRRLGRKASPSDGMVMSSDGRLFFGYLAKSAIVTWNSNVQPFAANQRIIAQDDDIYQWSDSFSIDVYGNLWNVAKRQSVIRTHQMDERPNFRIIKTFIGSKDCQYYKNGSAPNAPLIRKATYLDLLVERLKSILKRRFI